MPSLYRSSTRELSLSQIPEPLASRLREYAQKNQLELASVRAWLTHSENPPAEGFFGKLFGRRSNSVDPDAAHDTLLVLHPTHLVLGTAGEKRGCTVFGLPLDHASVTRGHALAGKLGAAAPSDDGITIAGLPGDEGRVGTYFFALGGEPAAAECAHAVQEAITARKNPR